jgi:hypothetical protein
MGTDIVGWVEMKPVEDWIGALRIDAFVGRHIHGFGSMFLEEGLFPPIAKGRGLPQDISEDGRRSYPEENWGHTWALWREIAAIDWDEVYQPQSPHIYKYVRHASGDRLLNWHGYFHEMTDPPPLDVTQQGEIEMGDVLYRVVHDPAIRRHETLHAGWPIVFNAMRFIAKDWGDENVRVVVWFNS